MKGKLNSIEAFRFIFMLMICIWHYQSENFLAYGYICVEFFFILSGILLFFSANKEKPVGTFEYALRRIKRFAPDCLLVIAFHYSRKMVFPVIFGKKDLDLVWLLKALPESLFLQNSGIYTGGLNYPMWYVSVMLLGGTIIYAILQYDRKLAITILLPIIVLIGYTYMFNTNPNGRIESFDVNGGIYVPMLRGVCGMSLGVLLGYILKTYKSKLEHIRTWVIDFLGIMSLFLFCLFAFMPSKESFDRYLLIIIPFLLLACFTERSVFNKIFKASIWSYLGSCSWQMLVYHGVIIIPLYMDTMRNAHLHLSQGLDILLCSLICVVLSMAFKALVPKITPMLSRLFLK